MTTLYGISNCDTIRKARRWLDAHNIDYDFHDYKKAGIDQATLERWCGEFGYENLLNRRGTTWRKLDEPVKKDLDESKAVRLMLENTSVIKRPVLVSDNGTLLGFDEVRYADLLGMQLKKNNA